MKWKEEKVGNQDYRKVGKIWDERFCYMHTFLGYFNKTRVESKEFKNNNIVTMLGAIGDDSLKESILHSLNIANVQPLLQIFQGQKTSRCGIILNNKEINKELNEELNLTKRNESKLTKENSELKIIKNKYKEIEEKLKDYLETKKENESFKKQFPEMKANYEKQLADDKVIHEREMRKLTKENDNKINELKTAHDSNMEIIKETYETRINKLNEETQKLKKIKKVIKKIQNPLTVKKN